MRPRVAHERRGGYPQECRGAHVSAQGCNLRRGGPATLCLVRAASRFRRFLAEFVFVVLCLAASNASAAGVRASGAAKASEWKQAPSSTRLRSRAIRRARLAALQAATDGLEGRVDKDAKKAVLRDGTRWTGAYRIVSEQVDPEGIRVEPVSVTRCSYMTKYGSGITTSSPGPTVASSESDKPPETPAVTSRPVSASS